VIWKTGDRVIVDCEGAAYAGQVLFASQNGKSLFLEFDAMIAGHVGQMPVLLDDDGVFRSIFAPHVAVGLRPWTTN
jgi:hypothetical protein